jgi:predicted DNA binding protein
MSLIVEFTIASPRLVLASAMKAVPGVSIRVESVDGVPPEDVVTMLWATSGDLDAWDDAIRADPTVTDVTLVDAFPDRRLYHYRVADSVEIQMYNEWLEVGAAQMHIEAQAGDWFHRIRFPDRTALREFREVAAEYDVGFSVHSIYTEPRSPDQNELTAPQEAAVELALEHGYFEIPRETDLEPIAEELGVSEQSTSERIRRAMRKLARNSV